MKIEVSSKRLFALICLFVIFSCFQTASPYIYQILHWYNPKTKKAIFMLSDCHHMGDRKQALEQFEKFKKICEMLKKKELVSQILFEDLYAYTLYYNIEEETMCKAIANKDEWFDVKFSVFDVQSNLSTILKLDFSISDFKTGSCSTSIDLWPFALKDTNTFVTYKSIDPRLIGFLWQWNVKLFEPLQQISFLSNFKNLILLKEKAYLNSDALGGELLRILKKIFDEMEAERFLELIEKHRENKKMIQKIISLEMILGTFFSRALEHEALLHMCFEHQFKYTFLVAGGAHTDYLSTYMKKLGFELVKTWGISTGEALELALNLPNDLKQKMDDAFDKIYNLIDHKIKDSTQNTNSTTSSTNQDPVQQMKTMTLN
jgi:hypothetical protein